MRICGALYCPGSTLLVFSHFQFDMTVYGFLSAWLIPGRQAGVLGEDQRREAKLVGSDIDDTRGSADFNLYPVVTVTHWADEDAAVVDAITPTNSGGVFSEAVNQC